VQVARLPLPWLAHLLYMFISTPFFFLKEKVIYDVSHQLLLFLQKEKKKLGKPCRSPATQYNTMANYKLREYIVMLSIRKQITEITWRLLNKSVV